MPSKNIEPAPMVDQDPLHELIRRFHERIDHYGCIRAGPFHGRLLSNDIIPMFALQQWATGPDQHTRRFYERMRPALQLASLFLTENSTLHWFCHYSYGEREVDSTGRTYIASTEYENSYDALEKVKSNIRKLGKVITLMFRPSFDHDEAYGMTYASKHNLPFLHHFRSSDWPAPGGGYMSHRRPHPTIVMHNDFSAFFSHDLTQCDPHVYFRTQFIFATTLVHEIAHAYSQWLLKDYHEPLWSKHDKDAELGYSWEQESLGYICNPLFHSITGCEMMFSMKAISYHHDHEHPHALQEALGGTKFHFAPMAQEWFQDLFQPQEYRGGSWYAGEPFNAEHKWVIAIYALPMVGIRNWFSEAFWEERHQRWNQSREYSPPPLGKTFMLVYQKNGDAVSVHYPLDPEIRAEVKHILRYEEARRRHGDRWPQCYQQL